MHIALLAPDLSGHRVHWIQHAISDAQAYGVKVTIYTVEGNQTYLLPKISSFADAGFIYSADLVGLMVRWREDVQKGQSIGVSLEADKILPNLIFARGKIRLLIMRPYLEEVTFTGLIRFLLKQALILILSLRRSIVVSRLSIPYSRHRSRQFRWVRDNYNTEGFLERGNQNTIPNELFTIPQNVKLVTLTGYLQARKNPAEAYKKIVQLRTIRNQRICLVLAGVQDEEFRVELSTIGILNDVIQIDRAMSDQELHGLLLKSDLVFLPYKNRGASGIVLNSLSVGTPVVIYGSRNWNRLQVTLQGRLLRGNKKNIDLVQRMSNLLDCPKNANLSVLQGEGIPTLSDFILNNPS